MSISRVTAVSSSGVFGALPVNVILALVGPYQVVGIEQAMDTATQPAAVINAYQRTFEDALGMGTHRTDGDLLLGRKATPQTWASSCLYSNSWRLNLGKPPAAGHAAQDGRLVNERRLLLSLAT